MSDEAHSFRDQVAAPGGEHQESRRDFLMLVAGAVGAVAVVATGYAVIDTMNPAGDVLAAGGPVDVDLSKVRRASKSSSNGAANRSSSSTAPRSAQGAAGREAGRPAERPQFRRPTSSRPTPKTGTARSTRNTRSWSGCARISAASRCFTQSPIRLIRRPIGSAAISARATARNTISPAACSRAFRRPTTCRSRPIICRTKRPCASARIPPGQTWDFGSIVQNLSRPRGACVGRFPLGEVCLAGARNVLLDLRERIGYKGAFGQRRGCDRRL